MIHRGSPYFFSEWSSLFLLPTKLVHLSLTWTIADFLRNNNGKWLMVVNLEKLFSMKNCPMVKKILKILYTCLKKKVYYVFLFLKVSSSQCIFKQKETILKLGNTLKSKSKFTKSKIGWGASICTLTRALHWTHGGHLTLGQIFPRSKISPYQKL